ncbi:MAG: histidine phosphatase family protein [Anaerolineae bacterium]|nr:histidine phosphatase family protein [Anaerolineae bacterium]
MVEEIIYLVRHGETIWNLEGRRQGHLDSPLTDRGYAQANAVAQWLSRELTDRKDVRIISSPLGRAMTTASIIAQHLGLSQKDIIPEPLLLEHHMGFWQGLTNEQIDDEFPGERKRRDADAWEYTIPGGESYARVYERAVAWLRTISEDWTVVAVAHAMISRTIRGAYACLDQSHMLAWHHPHNVIYRLHQGKIEEMKCD